MTESSYAVGYGRPPAHTRFRKGQSGNPGGRQGPKKLLKRDFDAALGEALNADEEALRQTKPGKVIESLARRLALGAVDGRPSAQRLVLAILDREDRDSAVAPTEQARTEPSIPDIGDEVTRRMLGDRYDEFRQRFDAARSPEDLIALAQDFEGTDIFPQPGNS